MMVRIQSMFALLVCAVVPLGALGGQPALTGSVVPPPAKSPFVDETYQADAGDVGGRRPMSNAARTPTSIVPSGGWMPERSS